MKQTMLSREKATYLFDHVFDGFKSSFHGIAQLKDDKERHNLTDQDIIDLLEKNSQRLIDRINAFKISQQVLAVFFAILLGYLQINGDDLDMRRSSRVRTSSSRSARSRTGRRKGESEPTTL